MQQSKNQKAETPKPQKKQYAAPRITRHGKVEEATKALPPSPSQPPLHP